ncbi:Protein fam72a [Linnemannia zychae]|nr:Protein fam72a [Linnemannia zychae]
MPHSIRDFYLNNSPANRNPSYPSSSNYNTISSSSAFGVNSLGHSATNNTSRSSAINASSSASGNINNSNSPPPRGYSSSFNTTYNINPSSLPSYTYTNRYLQQRVPATTGSNNTPGAHPSRMPQYPPPQYQYYGNAASSNSYNSEGNEGGYSTGVGHNNSYYGGGNSDRYNASYSSYGMNGGTPSSIGGTQSKTVCRMDCRYCSAVVCLRGMKAMLLADTSVELYSTDHPPGSVQLIDKDYTTSNCKCKIRDVACRVCGNVIGYHITQPCQQCLKAPNNGHFWMFHTEGVVGQERLNMDLGKLVQELVRFPHSAAGATNEFGEARRLPVATGFDQREYIRSSGRTEGPRMATEEPRTEASTTRMTSFARLLRQQRHGYINFSPPPYPLPPQPHILNSSPTPITPTPTTSSSSQDQFQQSNYSPASELPVSPSTAAALMDLTLSQFLQPMRWEQLPHPDLDIDLDPNTMGGEPLFAGDWMELVRRIAETAAANMSLALDQEEETEQYMARMIEEHHRRQLQQEMSERAGLDTNSSSASGSSEGRSAIDEDSSVIELIPDHSEDSQSSESGSSDAIEVDLEAGVMPTEDEEGVVAHLITRVDDIVITNAPLNTVLSDNKDEDEEMDVNGEPTGRGRTLERRQLDSLTDPNDAITPPGQETSTISHTPATESNRARRRRGQSLSGNTHSGIVTDAPPLHDRPTHRRRNSSSSSGSSSVSSDRSAYFSTDTCPAMVLTSAMIAKAAASAAAADAASAANNLLFGRRSRREYDMMCR